MFDESEWTQLVETLTQLTRQGRLKWHEDGSNVTTTVAGVTYVIGSVDNDGRQPYFLAVEEATDDPWASTKELSRLESIPEDAEWEYGAPAGGRLHYLRREAIRNALGAPQLLNRLLKDLEATGDDEPPF